MSNSKKMEIQKSYWESDQSKRRRPNHPVVEAAFGPLASMINDLTDNSSETSVLDIGCGNGFLSYALENDGMNVVGMDYSSQMIKNNPCKQRCLGSSAELPFKDNSFDIAVASHLLHHLSKEDRLKTMLEMTRVARRAVVSFEPNRNNPFMFLFSLIKKEERMAMKFSKNYMSHLFEQTPLKSCTHHVEGWIVPNRAPIWWIPVSKTLNKTFLRQGGFEICSIGFKQ